MLPDDAAKSKQYPHSQRLSVSVFSMILTLSLMNMYIYMCACKCIYLGSSKEMVPVTGEIELILDQVLVYTT